MPRRSPALDAIDVKILAALQREGRMTIQKLSGLVGLSARPCLERVRRLEASGIISGYRAILAIERLSRPVTVFAEIALERQGRQDELERRLAGIEEMVECWEVSGSFDYVARFVCADLARYETLTTDLIDDASLGIARVVSHVALRPVQTFRGYPKALLTPKPGGPPFLS
jgi:DNA-binding Lrp family transcriptional regulator